MAAFTSFDVLGLAPRRQFSAWHSAGIGTMARIDRVLAGMRRAGRRAILIVDNKCGDGRLLIRAAQRAAALGFVAVEAHGFDRSPQQIADARTAARDIADPRVRLKFTLRSGSEPPRFDDDEADLILADPDEDPPGVLRELVHPTGTIIDRE